MRTYRAAMVPTKFPKLDQPPLDGPMWPRVLGQRLEGRKLGPNGRLTGLGLVSGNGHLLAFPALTAAAMLLGPRAKVFYFLAAFFAVVSAQQAFSRWER